MKNLATLMENLKTGTTAKDNNLSPEVVEALISEFNEGIVDSMLLNGYVCVNEDLRIEIVPIQPRKYVLKGQEYKSTRVYKLKASMGDGIYNRICERYDQFRDDLED